MPTNRIRIGLATAAGTTALLLSGVGPSPAQAASRAPHPPRAHHGPAARTSALPVTAPRRADRHAVLTGGR